MSRTASLAAVNAKVGKLNSKLLKDNDYIELSHLKSVKEIIGYLQNNSEIGSQLNLYDRTYEVQYKMRQYRKRQLEKVSHYFSGDYRKFSEALMSEFEIVDIKRILRALKQKELSDFDLKKLQVEESFKLTEDSTLHSFINSLKHSRYYKVLHAYENESDDVILFYMEMNLDKLYYNSLVESSKTLPKKDYGSVLKLVGSKIDLLNINWIYRGLKHYNLLPEELINFCILGGNKLKYEDLKKLCYVENVDGLVEQVLNSEYKFLFDSENTDIYMDRRLRRYLYYLAKRESKKGNLTIGKYLAYTFLLDFEVKDISSIMETTRFDISFEEKLKFLARSYKGSEV
ncbi:V-type ATPase subunit [Anaerosphaera multitolerans]|uniref:ATPase n=1 Tax=Anaerosphaera multitolerans TaxID=2487351 RepID=A0A437S981_9FIRM|nr:V-type ATPase subunit [Anaerosphaera multitolerans]RVU55680.1 hypothetical protein EF514_00245 [Anaerosphaera multitolerans]